MDTDKSQSQMMLKLEALKKELAKKRKKLEVFQQGVNVREDVRKRVKEQNELDGFTTGTCRNDLKIRDGKQNVERKTIHGNKAGGCDTGKSKSVEKDTPGQSVSDSSAQNVSNHCQNRGHKVEDGRSEIKDKMKLTLSKSESQQIATESKRSGGNRQDVVNTVSVTNPCDLTLSNKLLPSLAERPGRENELNVLMQGESYCSSSSETPRTGHISKPMSFVNKNLTVERCEMEIINGSGLHNSDKRDVVDIKTSAMGHEESPVTIIAGLKSSASSTKLHEDSLCFITPSFQSGKQHSESVAVILDKKCSNQTARHSGLMSNADFLTVLGIPQKDYDTDRCESDLCNSYSDNVENNKANKLPIHAITSISRKNTRVCKPLSLKSDSCSMNIESRPQTSSLPMSQPMAKSSAMTSSASPLTEDYTELDVIPYSQFELTEDFLSESLSSQTNGSTNLKKGRGNRRPTGPLIKRKSPRLSSTLFPRTTPQDLSLDQNPTDNLFLCQKRRLSLSAQRKTIAVVSVFQLLVDEAKKKSFQDFQLPDELLGSLESKAEGTSIVEISKSDEFDEPKKKVAAMSCKDVFIVEDSEVVELSGEMGKHAVGCSQIKCQRESSEEVDVVADTEFFDLEEELDDVSKRDEKYFDAQHFPSPHSNSPVKLIANQQSLMENESGALNSSCEFIEIDKQIKPDKGGIDDFVENPRKIIGEKESKPDKSETILSSFGGDIVHKRTHSFMSEVEDNSVIPSSYHNTPIKRKGKGKRNKFALLYCRRSLNKSLATGEKLLAQFPLDNSKAEPDNNTGSPANLIKFDERLKHPLEMLPGPEFDTNLKNFSPLRDCGNYDSSLSFINSLMSSSTPKLSRHKNKVLPIQEAPSPIAGGILSPLQTTVMGKPKTLLVSPECSNMDMSQSRFYSETLTPAVKQIPTMSSFSPLEKCVPSEYVNTSKFYDRDNSVQMDDCDATLKASHDCSHSVGDYGNSLSLLFASPKADEASSLSKSLESVYPNNKKISSKPKPNHLETSVGKSPFSKYLEVEESFVLHDVTKDGDISKNFSKVLHSPEHVSLWQKIPKTATTPLQIFETSCTASPRLMSPVFTPSRVSRSRGASSIGSVKNRSKTLKFEGCFQSCSEDAVVQLLHGRLLVNKAKDDHSDENFCKRKRYLVSIQASALTIWVQSDENQKDWSPELDWRLSATIHILRACLLPIDNKIAIVASGWDRTHPIVTLFVYDFASDLTLRFNILEGLELETDFSISQIHLCPFPSSTTPPPPSPQLLLGVSSDSQHTLYQVTFNSDITKGVLSTEAFGALYTGKLNTLVLCRGQDKACASLTWDQRITIWNTKYRIALKTVAIPSYLPCLTALVDVRAVKGLLFVTASWRVGEMGDCGGILAWNPMTGLLVKTRFWNVPNAGWRSTEMTNKDKNQIYSVSSTGSVTWWDGHNGDIVGYRPSNIAMCVSGIEDKHLVVGEMHGCVHLYSM